MAVRSAIASALSATLLPAACLSAACVALAGCSASPPAGEKEAATASPSASPAASPSATPQAEARKIAQANETYDFEYTFPAQADAIPGLRAMLEERAKKDMAETESSAIAGRKDAETGGYPFHAYGYSTNWQVVTDLPGWLSLSATHWEFTGGAHGNTNFDSLLWDRKAETAREPLSLFTSMEALQGAAQPAFCNALDKQREEKRGEKIVRSADDWMTACIGFDSVTVILGSSNGQTFDRIGFLVPPYAAGPYAEGDYEVTLPVTPAVMKVVKPQYRASFSIMR
ncbi:PdaC/SigV domain-containing protein [Altererythrobacter fulvus]|uniref:PdaC/SigV domain-containing protein n=2 Tax=Sphingomonadales TaxID=204457 RepID=UPI003016F857